jgi:NADH-quinone oxidoreductase subunit H
VNMFTVSVMGVVLFFGGWYIPGLGLLSQALGLEWLFGFGTIGYAVISFIGFLLKIFAFLFLYIWVRGTLPRFRFDQLMSFGWKFLLPVALANVFFTIVIVYFLNS